MEAGHTGRHRHHVRGRGTFQEKSISQAPQSRWTPGWLCLSKLNEGSGGKRERMALSGSATRKRISPLSFAGLSHLDRKVGLTGFVGAKQIRMVLYVIPKKVTQGCCFNKKIHTTLTSFLKSNTSVRLFVTERTT